MGLLPGVAISYAQKYKVAHEIQTPEQVIALFLLMFLVFVFFFCSWQLLEDKKG